MKRISITTFLDYFDEIEGNHLAINKIYSVHEILLNSIICIRTISYNVINEKPYYISILATQTTKINLVILDDWSVYIGV